MAVATFTALQTPLLEGSAERTSYTWQQQFIEWKKQLTGLPIGLPLFSYGTGAPTIAGAENCLYFDTATSPYQGYVYHAGAWRRFS